mmetsp:Transcript_15210/g.40099  ORF Transcript_15210/g.40099 Transcript_15210/m.40099 type:complete len:82 (+) Transcript_15210:179-424(+)
MGCVHVPANMAANMPHTKGSADLAYGVTDTPVQRRVSSTKSVPMAFGNSDGTVPKRDGWSLDPGVPSIPKSALDSEDGGLD